MKRYCYLELSIFTDRDFDPWQFHKILGIKPSFCKLSSKEEIVLLSRDWRTKLEEYISSAPQNTAENPLKPLNYYKITSPIFKENISEKITNFIQKLKGKNARVQKIQKMTSCFVVIYLCGNFEGLIPLELISYCHDNSIRLGIDSN